ncbi:phage tail assembly protein [Ideonella sp. YS5]|uniref:phage tail assembly protein n=1 Tax=Ideonella sp. YS5 TaxID=3453714 RepID=UPI003EED8FE2
MSAIAFPFTLPRGYVDGEGRTHRDGRMRLATALDELEPLRQPSVQSNPAYLSVVILSRVVVELGDVQVISPRVIEGLAVADFAHLQDMYQRINAQGDDRLAVQCPSCAHRFEVEAQASGER